VDGVTDLDELLDEYVKKRLEFHGKPYWVSV
jgi:hypothetical protein